jgi:flagellar motility protein MotE (MotC chaperone)
MPALLKSNWVLALLGTGLYVVVTALAFNPGTLTPHARTAATVNHDAPRPSWEFSNPEMARLLTELQKEKESLGSRAKQLDELAARLAAERAEINVVTQAVHQMQMDFDRNLLRVVAEEQANLKRLAKTYAIMTPEGAAKIFKEMDDAQLVKIMAFMKEKETAIILEAMAQLGEAEVKRVALISERLRTLLFRDPTNKP